VNDTLIRLLSGDRCLVMGILNATPDSFSDGGLWDQPDRAVQHVESMLEAGADIIDIGGESTRPGSAGVPLQQELDRVIPLIETVVRDTGAPVSIDTSKPEVMAAAADAGAAMINDVYALRRDNALETAASLGLPVCLMHMLGEPRTMQQQPDYGDVVQEVLAFLNRRAAACREAGLPSDRIVIDPGFGFGKTLEHNRALFAALASFVSSGFPVLVGVSRKSMLGQITGRDVTGRVAASVAAALLAAQAGVRIVRVHDVAETVDAFKVLEALRRR
jgi:dihydropteroate synthase